MGLDYLVFTAFRRALNAVHAAPRLDAETSARGVRPLRVAALGYLDIVMTDAELAQAIGSDRVASLRDRANADPIRRAHHATGIARIPTMDSFFAALGCEVTAIDFAAHEGSELVWNLSDPVPPDLHGRFDIVLDGGTCEHVLDVATALRNCARMTALHGCVVHANPLAMGNHAFFGFNPTLIHDFYAANAFRVLSIEAFGLTMDGVTRRYKPVSVSHTGRFSLALGMETILLSVVQRERLTDTLVNPIQSVYQSCQPPEIEKKSPAALGATT
jgi:hypothetical protein